MVSDLILNYCVLELFNLLFRELLEQYWLAIKKI